MNHHIKMKRLLGLTGRRGFHLKDPLGGRRGRGNNNRLSERTQDFYGSVP
jgi:hypothetical protein